MKGRHILYTLKLRMPCITFWQIRPDKLTSDATTLPFVHGLNVMSQIQDKSIKQVLPVGMFHRELWCPHFGEY